MEQLSEEEDENDIMLIIICKVYVKNSHHPGITPDNGELVIAGHEWRGTRC